MAAADPVVVVVGEGQEDVPALEEEIGDSAAAEEKMMVLKAGKDAGFCEYGAADAPDVCFCCIAAASDRNRRCCEGAQDVAAVVAAAVRLTLLPVCNCVFKRPFHSGTRTSPRSTYATTFRKFAKIQSTTRPSENCWKHPSPSSQRAVQ